MNILVLRDSLLTTSLLVKLWEEISWRDTYCKDAKSQIVFLNNNTACYYFLELDCMRMPRDNQHSPWSAWPVKQVKSDSTGMVSECEAAGVVGTM